MTWEFHPARESFARYAADWDRLNAELYASHPYYDSRFVGPLLKHFASGGELLCLHREKGVIRGALILLSRGAGRWASFRPAQAQITPLLIADADLLKPLLKALPGFAWSIEFHSVDYRYAPSFSSLRRETITYPHAITIGIAPDNGFEPYWNQRPKKLKSNIRRYADRLVREDESSDVICYETCEAMYSGVSRFGSLESAGWKAAAGTAVSIDNVQGQFYVDVLTGFADVGQARVCELTFGETLAASRLIIGNQKMQVMLKTTYDESLARFAPGRLLLHRVLEQFLAENPPRTIEFYTNATRDQAEWATFSCAIQNIQLFRSEGAVVAFSLLKALQQRLAGISETTGKAEEGENEVEIRSSGSLGDLLASGKFCEGISQGGGIETSLDWFDLLQQQVYPCDTNVHYYFANAKGIINGILPLRQTHLGGVCVLESLSNYYTSLYSPLIGKDSEQQVLGRLLSAAAKERSGAHVMRLAPMDPDSSAYSTLLSELRTIGWIPLTYFCFGNWFLKVEGGWDDYLRKRSANLRSSIKRRNREFSSEGGTLELISGGDALESAIAAYLEVYAASWKKPEPYPDFVPSLIRLLAAKGMLRLGIARMQGQPIAAQLWIVGQGKASIYKVAYHEAYAHLSPGTVLTSYLMRHVIEEDKVREVDFLIGDDEYKKIWMSDRRERWGIVAFNPRTLVGFGLLLKELAGRAAKQICKK